MQWLDLQYMHRQLLSVIFWASLAIVTESMKTETVAFAAYAQNYQRNGSLPPTTWFPLGRQPQLDTAIRGQVFAILYLPDLVDPTHEQKFDFYDMISDVFNSQPHLFSYIPAQNYTLPLASSNGTRSIFVSSTTECNILYSCLYYLLQSEPDGASGVLTHALFDCVSTLYSKPMACPLAIQTDQPYTGTFCNSDVFALRPYDWVKLSADAQMENFVAGGPDLFDSVFWFGTEIVQGPNTTILNDTNDVWWPQRREPFSVAVGRQMLGQEDFVCTLEVPCKPALQCYDIGSHLAQGLGLRGDVVPCDWCFWMVAAMANINQQLSNQYVGIKGAAIEGTLRTFKIRDFWPQTKRHLNLLDALSGIAGVLTVISGFLPALSGAALGQGANAVSNIGTFLSRSSLTNPAGVNVPQEEYADAVAVVYADLISGLDTVTEMLFNGSSINNGFTIVDMMKGGAWVASDTLESVQDIETYLAIEIISRSINEIWKIPTHNKIFTIFSDLGDATNSTTKCQADFSGPPTMKYCADGGVYYTYNFIEDGDEDGHLSYPWGADKLQAEVNIDPQVNSPHSFKP